MLFIYPHQIAKKDGYPVLPGIYLVTPAAVKGGIFPSVTLK